LAWIRNRQKVYQTPGGNACADRDPGRSISKALIEFPTEDAMNEFMADPEYAPYAQARIAGTESQLIGIDASDAAGTIPYLATDN